MQPQQPPDQMTIGQLGHHPGLHVSVNLEGKTIDGDLIEGEQWVPGVVIGSSAMGDYVTIELDEPVGGGETGGLFHRKSRGMGLISIDDPARVKPVSLPETQPSGVPVEIVELVHAGKMLQAIKAYRALNGATLDEAKAALAHL
ncbi:MAG TPA: hypothetical protein VHW74_02615 [Mycobacteriales bacterium]|jgi:hypothetical protein|nr:hypothetical protein [Mycobacteriales bacterium]